MQFLHNCRFSQLQLMYYLLLEKNLHYKWTCAVKTSVPGSAVFLFAFACLKLGYYKMNYLSSPQVLAILKNVKTKQNKVWGTGWYIHICHNSEIRSNMHSGSISEWRVESKLVYLIYSMTLPDVKAMACVLWGMQGFFFFLIQDLPSRDWQPCFREM